MKKFVPNRKEISLRKVDCGHNVTVIEPSNLYECSLGDNSFVGPFCEIQSHVSIGHGCRIQSHAFICEFVTLGDNVFVGHGVVFINDKFQNGGPANGDKNLWCDTNIGNNVSIGSNSTILPVTICDNVVIGAGSVVTKDIKQPGVYFGNPAKKHES